MATPQQTNFVSSQESTCSSPNTKGHLYHNLTVPKSNQNSPSKSRIINDQQYNMKKPDLSLESNTRSPLKISNRINSQNQPQLNASHQNYQQRQKKAKMCKKCQTPIIGTLVRALDNVYHINCFTCYDCGKPCSQKFFSADLPSIEDESVLKSYPLCEYDYFKRLDVICYTCDSAIRGSYITALGRKYHPEHFYCEICHQLFDSDDYYANDGKIYCHYHYSQLHAFNCAGCHSAILKQYVELHRGGNDQQWHPECFMVHKFWNVDVTVDCIGMKLKNLNDVKNSNNANRLLSAENLLEKLTVDIWCTLSEFEESCASCISEMLHAATMCNKHRGLAVAAHLVLRIETLFTAFDSLDKFAKSSGLHIGRDSSIIELSKEPRSLSGKLLFYLSFLRDVTLQKLKSTKYSQDLLSLVSGLAHYIKLISRTGITLALEYNKLSKTMKGTDIFLREILSSNNKIDKNSLGVFPHLTNVTSRSNDYCETCKKSIEDSCALWSGKLDSELTNRRWHFECLKCNKCHKGIRNNNKNNNNNNNDNNYSNNGNKRPNQVESLAETTYNPSTKIVLCASCASQDVGARTGFREISKLLQFIYLLKIALLRSRAALNKHDNKVNDIQRKNSNHIGGNTENSSDAYDKSVNDITRRRSMREDRKLQNVNKEIKKSIIVTVPVADAAGTENTEDDISNNASIVSEDSKLGRLDSAKKYLKKQSSVGRKGSKKMVIHDLPNKKAKAPTVNATMTSRLLQNEKSLTLDDIPRIVSTEQAREYRPNAFRFQKRNFSPTIANLPPSIPVQREEKIEINNGGVINKPQVKIIGSEGSEDPKVGRRYSDLNDLGHEYMRHVAAFALWQTLSAEYQITLDDCLALIDVKKNLSFWNKIFGKDGKDNESNANNAENKNEFKSGSATTSGTGEGVFGVSLATVVNRYGIDSDLGVGESRVRIPILIDELIRAMKTQDLSAEGVFRLNGNIRKLRALVEELDGKHNKPEEVLQRINLRDETPIQLAAILKKFLRDLPVPLLTFKLYDLFLLSQRIAIKEENEEKYQMREKLLKICYALLPKVNRDLTEVLFAFLSWVATFAHLESNTGEMDGGSKMDSHNLATVLTPNILYSSPNTIKNGLVKIGPFASIIDNSNGENQFLSIEVINEIIENNDDLSIIPEPLFKLFTLAGFDKINGVKINGYKNVSRLSTVDSVNKKERETNNNLNTREIIAKLKVVSEKNCNILKDL